MWDERLSSRRRTGIALLASAFAVLAGSADASIIDNSEEPMRNADYQGTLRSDHRAHVAIRVVAGGRRVLFQARNVEAYPEQGDAFRIRSFDTIRAPLRENGTFDIDRDQLTAGGFASEAMSFYRVHGQLEAGIARGFLLWSYDNRNTGISHTPDASTLGTRPWRALAR